MRHLKLAGIAALAAATLLAFAAPTYAATAAPCAYGAITQYDMTGVYWSAEWSAYIEVFPCGGTYIGWENNAGRHGATYVTTGRVRGGGYFLEGLQPADVGYPDSAYHIAFKPAERGYVQLITYDRFDNFFAIYRLLKLR
jgi:hypothetical protein